MENEDSPVAHENANEVASAGTSALGAPSREVTEAKRDAAVAAAESRLMEAMHSAMARYHQEKAEAEAMLKAAFPGSAL